MTKQQAEHCWQDGSIWCKVHAAGTSQRHVAGRWRLTVTPQLQVLLPSCRLQQSASATPPPAGQADRQPDVCMAVEPQTLFQGGDCWQERCGTTCGSCPPSAGACPCDPHLCCQLSCAASHHLALLSQPCCLMLSARHDLRVSLNLCAQRARKEHENTGATHAHCLHV